MRRIIFRGRQTVFASGSQRRKFVPLAVTRLETRDLPAAWTPLVNFIPDLAGAQQLMLLSDGTVLIQGGNDSPSNNWYRLTPNSSGSYINGTFTTLASSNVSRLFFTSDMLPNGKVLILGGEYSGTSTGPNDTNTGEIYSPVANTWTSIANFPNSQFGDDPSEVLPNGNVLAGYISGPQTYIYNPTSNTWSQTGTKLQSDDRSDEETWVKLPDNSILTYDIFSSISSGVGHAERYIPSTGSWVDAGTVPVALSSSGIGDELGPGFLLSDGRVFLTGATGNNAFYTPSTNSWAAAPVTPNGKLADDNPGAVLPNGHVIYLADSGPTIGTAPTQVFDFDPAANTITQVSTPAGLTDVLNNRGAYDDQMLVLPNGDILLSTGGRRLWEYTPDGSPNPGWAPTISNIVYDGNQTYTLTGTQLNGISEGANYGDDAEMASNYPIVRLTSSGGTVYYARTFNWSSTGVQTGSTPVSTQFTLPANLPFAAYSLSVIANGIASTSVNFTPLIYADTHWAGMTNGTVISDADPLTMGNQSATIGTNAFATVDGAIGAAPAGGLVIVNGADGTTGSGVFNEPIAVNKPVTLYFQQGAIAFGSLAGSSTGANIVLNDALTVGADNTNTEYDGILSGASGFTKTGTGTLTLTANESYTGATMVSAGNLFVSGSLSSASPVTVTTGSTLSGTGHIGGATTVDGTVAPGNSVGILTTGQLTFDASGKLSINIMGPTAGTNYSQIVSNGPVNVTGATLAVSVASGFTPSASTPIDILVNQSGTAIVGTFAGLADGAAVTANGDYFTISYFGGSSGHDIVLTPTTPPSVASIQVNDGSAQRSEVRSIAVTFSGPVTFAGSGTINDNAAAAFQLLRIQDATNVNLSATVLADGQNRSVVVLTFSGSETDPFSVLNNGVASLADGRYRLTILAANVTGSNGLALDGVGAGIAGNNYVSPTDTHGGGPGQLHLYRLFDDASGDGVVDAFDLGQFRTAFNTVSGNPLYLAYLDADNNGAVDSQDLGQFRTRFNTTVF